MLNSCILTYSSYARAKNFIDKIPSCTTIAEQYPLLLSARNDAFALLGTYEVECQQSTTSESLKQKCQRWAEDARSQVDKAFSVDAIESVVEEGIATVCKTAEETYGLFISGCPIEEGIAAYGPEFNPQYDDNGNPIYNTGPDYSSGSQIFDANGAPLYDLNGNPIYGNQEYDDAGMPVFDEGGNPVYKPDTTDITAGGFPVGNDEFESVDNELMATKAQIDETRAAMKAFVGEKPPGFDELFISVEAFISEFQVQHEAALQARSIEMTKDILTKAYDLQAKLKEFYNAFIATSGGETSSGAPVPI
jgi:hypothetical protein